MIERRLENLLALDYPADKLAVVVASDGSTDGTDAAVEAWPPGSPACVSSSRPRAGKVAAQDAAVEESGGEIVAFSDASALWEPDALRTLVRNFADPDVAYVCGRLVLVQEGGSNREGLYWRYEMWLRESESGSLASRAGTAPSTPCAAGTTSMVTHASVTTSAFRT